MARQKRMQGFFKAGGYWYLRTDPVTGKKLTTHCKAADTEGALRFRELRRQMAEAKALEALKPQKLADTLGEWLDKLLVAKREKAESAELSEATVDYYEVKINPLKRHLGAVPIALLRPTHYDEYVSARRNDGAKGHTIKKELAVSGQALARAKRSGCVPLADDGRPIDCDELFPSDLDGSVTPGMRALSLDEFQRFFSQLPSAKWRAFVVMCVLGMRKSEALRQRAEYFEQVGTFVRQPDGTITESVSWICWIDGRKTDSSDRAIPILSPFAPLVESVLDQLPVGMLHNFDRAFKTTCARAEIPDCNRNDLRRTNATWLVEHGLDERTVAGLLGHKSIQMAQRHYNRAKAIALGPVAEAKLLGAAPMVFDIEERDAPSPRSRKVDRFPALPGEQPALPAALGNRSSTVRISSESTAQLADSLRTPKDSNLRPSDSKSQTQPEQIQETTVLPGAPVCTNGHQSASSWVHPVRISSGSVAPKRPAFEGGIVPLIASDGRVVSWVGVTSAEVEEDLAPSRYLRRTVPPVKNSTDPLRGAAHAFADRFEGVAQ